MEIIAMSPDEGAPTVHDGVYRVEFVHPDRPAVDAWRVLGARDLVEVLDWAHAEAHGRRLVVSLEVEAPDGTVVVPIYREALAASSS